MTLNDLERRNGLIFCVISRNSCTIIRPTQVGFKMCVASKIVCIDNICAMVIVWRKRGKLNRTVLCCVVYHSCELKLICVEFVNLQLPCHTVLHCLTTSHCLHCRHVTTSHCITLCHTVALCHTMSHCVTLYHIDHTTLSHCHHVTMSHCITVSHCRTVSYHVTLYHTDHITLLHCHYVALYHTV